MFYNLNYWNIWQYCNTLLWFFAIRQSLYKRHLLSAPVSTCIQGLAWIIFNTRMRRKKLNFLKFNFGLSSLFTKQFCYFPLASLVFFINLKVNYKKVLYNLKMHASTFHKIQQDRLRPVSHIYVRCILVINKSPLFVNWYIESL